MPTTIDLDLHLPDGITADFKMVEHALDVQLVTGPCNSSPTTQEPTIPVVGLPGMEVG